MKQGRFPRRVIARHGKGVSVRNTLFGIFALLAVIVFLGLQFSSVRADSHHQIPTGNIPTVTGTPPTAMVTVLSSGEQDQINVRAGPGTVGYDIVGVLVVGQSVPALGRTPGGDWIEIVYPGVPGGVAWVYSPLVKPSGSLPVVEPPPTSTPRVTATIDPTLAAQFLVELPPTRMPTFTPAPPLVIPTFPPDQPVSTPGRVPMGLLIIGMAVVGLFGAFISFLRGR